MLIAVTIALVPITLMVAYLDLLTVASILFWRAPTNSDRKFRFAIMVPALDEEALLPRLLDSLRNLDYPREFFDVHVVADNCGDTTALVGRQHGALVHERYD